MLHNKRLHISKYLLSLNFSLLILLTFIFHLNALATEKIDPKELEGYQVKFDYEGHPKEREIAYQYYLDKENQYLPGITKNQIGIDLYDIDDDGKKEIFLYIDGGDRCPRAGCPFAILKLIKEEKSYKIVPWGHASGRGIAIYNAPLILRSKSLGYNNILFIGEDKTSVMWKWNGKYYD